MQREIKFRGKRMDNNEWSFGNIVISGHNIFIVYDATEDDYKYAFENVFILVLPETVGQYTGKKDMYGVEIWEGDIITYDLKEGLGEPALYNKKEIVEFYRDNCHHITSWYRNIRVIGNIHENKDLIK